MAQKTIRFYLMVQVFEGFAMAVHGATYVIFLLSYNLNLFQVNLVNAIFMAALVIFELPTGIIADLFGRKLSFTLSCFTCALGFWLYFLANCFWEFVLAEIVLALGMTFASGAFQAWLVDSLDNYHFNGDLKVIFSHGYQVSIGAKIVGALIGAWLANFNLAIPWLIAALTYLALGIIVLFWMKEDYFKREAKIRKELFFKIKAVAIDSFSYILKDKNVLLLILIGAGFSFACQSPNMQWQPFFNKFSQNYLFLGWVKVGILIALFIGTSLAPYLVRLLRKEKWTLFFSYMLVGLGLILVGSSNVLVLILVYFFVHEIGRGSERPIREALLNELIPSSLRATILSFDGQVQALGMVLGLLVSGLLAELFSISLAWIVSGLIFVFLSVFVLRLKRPC